jgi:hypothetical protein
VLDRCASLHSAPKDNPQKGSGRVAAHPGPSVLAHASWPIFGIDWAEPASGGKYSVEAGGFMGKRLARRELFQEITVDREALHNF